MDNIIQLIVEKVKGEIEKNVEKILKGSLNLDETVDSVGELVNDLGLNILKEIIEKTNQEVKKSSDRKSSYHIHKSNVERSLITRFGELNFTREYYKNISNKTYVYILDKILGIEKYERIEANLKGEILDKVVDFSYQTSAKLSSKPPITKETVKNIIRENGKIDNLELEIQDKKIVETIYIEADEDHIALQNGKNEEVKLIYVYDEKEEINGRIELKNKRYFTGKVDTEELWTDVATYIDQAYDMDKVEDIYLAGDGASWIKTGLGIIKGSKYVLDHYHLSKYVKILTAHLENLENPIYITKPLWEYMRKNQQEYLKELIDIAIEMTLVESKRNQMKKAKRYILNNWIGIVNLFREKKYSCSAEGHISHILSSRLSSRPMGWSSIGADEISRMRVYKANGGSIKEYYREARKSRKEEERIELLDMKIFSKGRNKKYATIDPDMMIEMPYTSKSDGKWLKNMFKASSF